MALEFADRLIVAIEQGGFAGTALNVIDRMVNSMTKTAVFFSLQTNFVKRNS
jgi:hypothetical protein